jgi:hypothetical protein
MPMAHRRCWLGAYPGKYLMYPATEFERLRDQIDKLSEILSSHCDSPVSDLLSGFEPRWTCAGNLEDLREQVRELQIQEEANYDLSKQNAKLRATVITWTEDVSREDQIEAIRQALRNGEL